MSSFFFLGKFVGFMFCWELDGGTLSFCCCCPCWNFEHCMIRLEILVWSCCALFFGEFLNCWVILKLVNLCFRSVLISWKRACGWLEVCSLWHTLNLLNMWSMKWTRYKWCFLNALCLNLHDNGSNTCLCWFFRTAEWQWLMPTQDPWRRGS